MFKYPPIIDFRWWVSDISKEVTPLGLKLKVMTSHAVNLFMVWTDVEPTLENVWKMRRGVKVHCDPIFHLVNPRLVDEDFPADHRTHYFTFDDWPVCQTRWFYFIAKVWVLWTKSTSFLHSYHKQAVPQWYIFYPDRIPCVTSSDGFVQRMTSYAGTTWADVHDGAATELGQNPGTLMTHMRSGNDRDKWRILARSGIIFDTSALPRPGIAQEAYVRLWGKYRGGAPFFPNFKVGLTAYDQDDNTQIALADYHHFLPYEASATQIPWANILLEDWNIFHLNSYELGALRDHVIREFGLREMSYDFGDAAPPWVQRKEDYVHFSGTQNVNGKRPTLRIQWLETGG
ncbi:hypothetical protein ES708_32304 [subsurface metagenome]